MADFYLDADVSLSLAELLRDHGHTVRTSRGEGRERAKDPAQLLFSSQHGLVFITHNVDDFRLLHDAWLLWIATAEHSGILALEQVPVWRLAQAVEDLLRAHPSVRGQMWEWTRSKGWEQRLIP